jgi:hypothetical protein
MQRWLASSAGATPVVLWPADSRRLFETEAMIAMAGEITANRMTPTGGLVDAEPAPIPTVSDKAPLTPREASALEATEARSDLQSDWEHVHELLSLMIPEGITRDAYYGALQALTIEIVHESRFRLRPTTTVSRRRSAEGRSSEAATSSSGGWEPRRSSWMARRNPNGPRRSTTRSTRRPPRQHATAWNRRPQPPRAQGAGRAERGGRCDRRSATTGHDVPR